MRNLHTVFHSGYTNLQLHQQCMRISFSSHPHQHFSSVFFSIIAILTSVKFSCCGFDLIFPDALRCWTTFHVPVGHLHVFFGKKFIQVFCPFIYAILSCMNSLYILDINPLSDIWVTNIFSHSVVDYLFILLVAAFCVQKLSNLM